MNRISIPFLLPALLCAAAFALPGQVTPGTVMEGGGTVSILPPSPVRAAIWTDKLGYVAGETHSVYVTMDPMGDDNPYTLFLYRENIETGERTYLSINLGAGIATTHNEPVNFLGLPAPGQAAPLATVANLAGGSLEQVLVHSGPVPAQGLWHYVAELRDPSGTQAVKRVFAKFVVATGRIVLGQGGTDTEISSDTTWSNDSIVEIRHQVFVNPGATLTIEPGTLVLAQGQNATLVIERGARIMAEGRREAPIVMSCNQPLGLRESGCWAGLIVLGNAPMNRGEGRAEAVIPETRPVYGGDDPNDSSGVLRYVRVEFAGVDFNPETQPNAFGFHGVGAGTVIEYIQAHEGDDDGIEFFGGTASCLYCVSSGAKDDSLDWAFGWTGTAQNLFVIQDPSSDNGIEADNDSSGFDNVPRSHPAIYNATLVGGLQADPNGTHGGDGMRIRVGTAITARNMVLMGFGGDALDARDNSPDLFSNGTSSIENAIITGNAGAMGDAQIKGLQPGVAGLSYQDVDPMLTNVRYEANPDPRPVPGSPALAFGAAATPPSDGVLDTSEQCVGAFCGENWLEEWTFFGDEFDYDVAQ